MNSEAALSTACFSNDVVYYFMLFAFTLSMIDYNKKSTIAYEIGSSIPFANKLKPVAL